MHFGSKHHWYCIVADQFLNSIKKHFCGANCGFSQDQLFVQVFSSLITRRRLTLHQTIADVSRSMYSKHRATGIALAQSVTIRMSKCYRVNFSKIKCDLNSQEVNPSQPQLSQGWNQVWFELSGSSKGPKPVVMRWSERVLPWRPAIFSK